MSAPGPAETPEPAAKQKPLPAAGLDVPTYILFASALALGLTLLFTPALIAFGVALLAGIAGALACEWLARSGVQPLPRHPEPWRFDGFCIVVATLALLALGASIGAEAMPVGWLLVALLAALGMAGIGSARPPA